jgi:hypothetical protein
LIQYLSSNARTGRQWQLAVGATWPAGSSATVRLPKFLFVSNACVTSDLKNMIDHD